MAGRHTVMRAAVVMVICGSVSAGIWPNVARASPNPLITIDQALGWAPSNTSVDMIDLGSAAGNQLVTSSTLTLGTGNAAATISFSGGSAVMHGNLANVSVAPWAASGQLQRNYVAAQTASGVTISFAARQQYFGLLWGSVDLGNTLDFYNGAIKVATLTGADVLPNVLAGQGYSDATYVNINLSGTAAFDRVVASNNLPAFEFGAIAYSTQLQSFSGSALGAPLLVTASGAIDVPAPGATTLLGGLAALLLLARRRGHVPTTSG